MGGVRERTRTLGYRLWVSRDARDPLKREAADTTHEAASTPDLVEDPVTPDEGKGVFNGLF